jgi:hypothetical protein
MNVIAGQEAKPLAARELEPHELDAVVGGLAVYSVPISPIWKAFLDGFYSTCGCSPGYYGTL